MVALNLFVYQLTGSALTMGLFLLVRLGSGAVTGLTAGRLLYRLPHRRIMVWTSTVQAAVLVVLVMVPAPARLPVLFASATVGGCGSTLFLVALRSAIPDLVGQDQRDPANSLIVVARSLGMVAGFASAPPVISWQGYPVAFLVDAGTFVVCAFACLSIPAVTRPEPRPTPARTWSGPVLPKLGLLLVMVIGLRALDAFGSASHNAALPVYSAADHADPAAFAGRFLALWAIGNIIVQQAVRGYRKRRGHGPGLRGFAGGTVLMSAAFILAFTGLPLVLTAVIAVAAGCADGLTEVSYSGYLQRFSGPARDRAFGLSATAENTGFGLGMLACSVLLDRCPPVTVVAASHGAAILAVLLLCTGFAWHTRKRARRARGYVDRPHRDHRDVAQVPGG
ncbi:MFS transporter [Amycolatopsis sp. RM579]|uniref:MFS transporter n=2 Tax=Amycolatopsis pithecellobii TaxID=664692 RepID=A0A6N7YR59_9PSEU|nr:MFS transporter [Amycolatopsis pithecellobii]